MTREEAMQRFQNMKLILSIPNSDAERQIEACDMAIEALQDTSTKYTNTSTDTPTNTSTDLISRQGAIEAVATVTMSIHLSNVLCDKLLALPSADAVQIPIKLEKRYPQSRDEDITDAFMRGYLAGRSSADRPTGEWVEVEKNEYEGFSIVNMRCNQCGKYAYLVLPRGTKCVYDYCPWCKADMRGEEE